MVSFWFPTLFSLQIDKNEFQDVPPFLLLFLYVVYNRRRVASELMSRFRRMRGSGKLLVTLAAVNMVVLPWLLRS